MHKPVSLSLIDTIKYITSHLKVDSERIRATFEFPPPPNSDIETLATALEKILFQYFKIILSADFLSKIKDGRTVQFLDDSVIGLPPRTISALLRPNNSLLRIEGKSPVNGRDGYSEVFYPWKKEAGRVDDHGNIDLKRTNALAGVNKGDLLATISTKTDGSPGITFDGKKISQQKGHANRVKWREAEISRSDDTDSPHKFNLLAKISGLIQSIFLKRDDPSTLSDISIQESVTINGDINYGIGNQGSIDGEGGECAFSLKVTGNVKGAFSLQSNGFIHVSGTIEGKSVTAREITAELITGGCVAKAIERISTNNIVNATAEAKEILVAKNASGSTLIAHLVTLSPDANFVGMTVETKSLISQKNNFSGRNKITFIPQLFEQFAKINKENKTNERLANQASIPNKEIATAMLTDIARIESIIAQKRSPAHEKISAMMVDLKLPIINALQTTGKNIDKKMVQHCYTLQTTLSEAKYDESLLRKIESLITHIKKYNATSNQLGIILECHQENIQRAGELEAEIRNNLILTLQSPRMIGQNSALCVKCGLIEEVFTAKDFKGNTIEIKYVAPSGEKDISQGKIVLTGKL